MSFALTGCGGILYPETVGPAKLQDEKYLQTLTVNESTIKDVEKLYGKPLKTEKNSNGDIIWHYQYVKWFMATNSITAKDATFTFNKSGVLTEYTYGEPSSSRLIGR